MNINGNHPIAEIIAKKMVGIETVPNQEQRNMVQRACYATVKYVDENYIRKQAVLDALYYLAGDVPEYRHFADNVLNELEQK